MKKLLLRTATVGLVTILVNGCTATSEKIYPQKQENISSEDIVIYQQLVDDNVDVEQYNEEAKRAIEKTFAKIEKTNETIQERADSDQGRFFKVIKSFKKRENYE